MQLVIQLLFAISLIALIWLIVLAFKRSTLWGFGVLLLSPITATIYAVKYWKESKKPFSIYATTFVAGMITLAYAFTSWGGAEIIRATAEFEGQDDTLNDEAAFEFAHATLNFIENADESQAEDVAAMRRFLRTMESGSPNQAGCGLYEKALRAEQDFETRSIIRRNMIEMGCGSPASSHKSNSASGRPKIAQSSAGYELQSRQQERVRYEQVFKPVALASAAYHVGKPVIVTRKNGMEQECKLVGVGDRKLMFEQRVGTGTMTFSYYNHDIAGLQAQFNVPI